MADQKISELTELAAAPAANDVLPIVDVSASSTKKITAANLFTSPTFVTPALGTPASGTLTNCGGTAASLTAGLATDTVTKTGTGSTYATNTSPTFVTPVLGTPSSGTLTSCTGLPEAGLTLADNTTANASTTAHGFLKKLDNTATNFMNGAGNWANPNAGAAGGIDVSAVARQSSAFSTTSTSYVDITNPATISLVTTATDTIMGWFSCGQYNTNNTADSYQLLINGTIVNIVQAYSSTVNQNISVTCSGMLKAVASGTIVVKVQCKVGAGTLNLPYDTQTDATLSAIAWKE